MMEGRGRGFVSKNVPAVSKLVGPYPGDYDFVQDCAGLLKKAL